MIMITALFIIVVWIIAIIHEQLDINFWNGRGFFGWLSDKLLIESLRAEAEKERKLREQREQIAEAEKIWGE